MTKQSTNLLMQGIRKRALKEYGFDVANGWTVAVKETKNGQVIKQLANFVAWPKREVLVDDGEEVTRYFDIQGIMAGDKPMPDIQLSHTEFLGDLNKCFSRLWGMDVVVKRGTKDDLREAIQVLGRYREQETVYTYTGWRRINDRWVYLHAGGAVGANNVRVDLSEGGEALTRYALPPCCNDEQHAANVCFSLLRTVSPKLIYPLFAAVFLAPLCQVLRTVSLAPDFMTFLVGRTQSGKSTLAALLLSFFGDFDKTQFPANYLKTSSSIERISFLLKDTLIVIDDYFPGQSHKERESMKDMAQKLARAYGDGAVRSRMGVAGKLQRSSPPRGLAISTAEERPEIGESGQARFVFLDVTRDDMDYDALLEIQRQKHYLAEFMVMYLQWVSENWERIPAIFIETYEHAKTVFVDEEYSGRINESIAKLFGGLEVILTFAKERGFVTEEEYERHGELAVEAFEYVLRQNVTALSKEKPTQRFLSAMVEIISNGQGNLCSVDDESAPINNLGSFDEEYVYLSPKPCYQAVQTFYCNLGRQFTIGDKTLWRHLREDGIIERSESRNRHTHQKTVPTIEGRKSDEVLILHAYHLGLK